MLAYPWKMHNTRKSYLEIGFYSIGNICTFLPRNLGIYLLYIVQKLLWYCLAALNLLHATWQSDFESLEYITISGEDMNFNL